MTTVSIIYFSGSGHTTKLAEAITKGAASVADVQTNLITINGDDIAKGRYKNDAVLAQLDASDAIIFGSPTYMGGPSWQFKKFADASSKPWFTQKWKDKIAAGFTNSATINGDKHSTLHYFMTLAMQHSMLWVGTGMMPSNSKAAQRNDINWLGSFGGLMAQSPSDASPDEGPLPGDLETARLFGKRIVDTLERMN